MARSALIVVDVQLDFMPGGALGVWGGDQVVTPINALMDGYDAVVLTQDWHPANHSSFVTNHPGAEGYSTVEMPYGPQILWPSHCVQGSEGAQFHAGLNTDRADAIIRKGFRTAVDSYSAFFENDHATPTGLAGYLQTRGIEALTFVGLAHDFCVAWSALDAVRLGFKAEVLAEATRAIDLDGSLLRADAVMRASGIAIR